MTTEQIRNIDKVPPAVVAKAVRRLEEALRRADSHSQPELAPREAEMARLVEQGITNPEIAERMGITSGTVSGRLVMINYKFGLKSSHELVFGVRGGAIIRTGGIVGGRKRPLRLASLPLE